MRREKMKRALLCVGVLLLALLACGAFAEESIPPVTLPEVMAVPGGQDNNEELFDAYVAGLFSLRRDGAKVPRSVGDRLTGRDAIYYGLLKGDIQDVAAGRRTSTTFEVTAEQLGVQGQRWTAEDLGVAAVVANGAITSEAIQALSKLLICDVDYMLDVLLADLPYDLYWYDKTVGTSYGGMSFGAISQGGVYALYVSNTSNLHFSFTVHADYAAGTYVTDPARVQTANAAVERAHVIVSAHAAEGDFDKLDSYRREICQLTSYNSAAAKINGMYGDPWQIVYVFDGDPATTVVCEGYSKAFQYLCDLSTFREKVTSYVVTGNMTTASTSGLHMWNIVTMPDENNYVADVTNCDAGTIGAPDLLFLAGYSNNIAGVGYAIRCGSHTVTYEYSQDTKLMFTSAELAIASARYEPPAVIPDLASLTTLTLPSGLVTLEASALEGVAVQRIVLPEGLTSIESRAFAACPNLVYINLPAGLETIAPDAFADCSLRRIYVECAGDTAENGIFAENARLYPIP